MSRSIATLFAALVIIGASHASAQGVAPDSGSLEVTVIPGGGTFFASKNGAPSFGDYMLGADVTYNITRIVGIEGEVAGSLGVSQNLGFSATTGNLKSPDLASYSANLVLSAPTHVSVVPYVTGGIGGLTLFKRAELGVGSDETFLTGNVGGGVKWYSATGRWGLRGDYRFTAVRASDTAPAFFGTETRYGHRVYGGVVLNVIR